MKKTICLIPAACLALLLFSCKKETNTIVLPKQATEQVIRGVLQSVETARAAESTGVETWVYNGFVNSNAVITLPYGGLNGNISAQYNVELRMLHSFKTVNGQKVYTSKSFGGTSATPPSLLYGGPGGPEGGFAAIQSGASGGTLTGNFKVVLSVAGNTVVHNYNLNGHYGFSVGGGNEPVPSVTVGYGLIASEVVIP